jgi:molybdenum cofactor cytidylyltransferase
MISAIILAAGRSRRMGAQKLLLPLAGKPLIARIVDEVLESPVDEVLVVTGRDGQRIAKALEGREVRLVPNPDVESEMLGSVRRGLTAVAADSEAVLVVLGDQAGISGLVVTELVRAFRSGGRGIVVPTFDRKRGHPILFSASYGEEVLREYDEVGLRGLLQAHPEDVAEIPVSTREVIEDIDVPEDYRRMRSRLSTRQSGG